MPGVTRATLLEPLQGKRRIHVNVHGNLNSFRITSRGNERKPVCRNDRDRRISSRGQQGDYAAGGTEGEKGTRLRGR
jgi:hypothetical protein